MNKKYRVLFALSSAILLAACGNGESDATENGATDEGSQSQESSTVTFLIDNQTVTDGLNAVAAEIEEQFNIVTEFELRPGGTEGDNLVKTRLATDEMTDLMWYNSGSLFQALDPDQYFTDLSDQEYVDRIIDDFVGAVSTDEGIYGVPGESTFAGGWMYNRNIYDELDLEVPRTWDELLENNDIIADAGYVPAIASYEDTWTAQVILLGDYYNIHSEDPDWAEKYTHNEAKFADTPVALRGFEKAAELQERGHFNDEETSTSYENAIDMLVNGEAAHYPMLTLTLQAIYDRFPDQVNDIGFFGQPGDNPDDHGVTIWLPGTIAVYENSDNKDAALQWLEFYMSEEGQEIYMANMQAVGPYALEDVELPDDAFQAVHDMLEFQEAGKTAPALEFLSPLKGPNLEQIMVETGLLMTPPAEAAANYDNDVSRQAQQLQLDGWD